jgi:hypothetical protein
MAPVQEKQSTGHFTTDRAGATAAIGDTVVLTAATLAVGCGGGSRAITDSSRVTHVVSSTVVMPATNAPITSPGCTRRARRAMRTTWVTSSRGMRFGFGGVNQSRSPSGDLCCASSMSRVTAVDSVFATLLRLRARGRAAQAGVECAGVPHPGSAWN